MECKGLFPLPPAGVPLCINRNIVECKEHFVVNCYTVFRRINRNIVECKDGTAKTGKRGGKVLIET